MLSTSIKTHGAALIKFHPPDLLVPKGNKKLTMTHTGPPKLSEVHMLRYVLKIIRRREKRGIGSAHTKQLFFKTEISAMSLLSVWKEGRNKKKGTKKHRKKRQRVLVRVWRGESIGRLLRLQKSHAAAVMGCAQRLRVFKVWTKPQL